MSSSLLRFASTLMLLGSVLAAGCGAPGSGTIEGLSLGRHLGLDLTDLDRQQPAFSPEQWTRAATLFAAPRPDLDSLRLYTARAEVDEAGARVLRVAWLPLPEAGPTAALVLAVGAEGVLYRARIVGRSDPETTWENFWRQFEYRQTRTTLPPADTFSEAQVEKYWADLQQDTTQAARTLQALYRHQVQMRHISYLFRRTWAHTDRGTVPEPAWLVSYAQDFEQLATTAAALEPLLGHEATVRYQALAQEAQRGLQPLVTHARAQEPGKLRDALSGFRRRTCVACHNLSPHTLGPGTLQQALQRRFGAAGVRQDLYRVGLDVWAMPTAPDASQRLARTIKMILVLLGS